MGLIELWFGDESHVCTSGYVPYGWQFSEEDVYVPVQKEQRLNILAWYRRLVGIGASTPQKASTEQGLPIILMISPKKLPVLRS